MSYSLVKVDSDLLEKEFIRMPIKLYKNTDSWVRPLDNDIRNVFDSNRNKVFRTGECCRWILRAANGETVGRVAAFFDNKTAKKGNEVATGGMGFFECIEDQQAANVLFEACQKWLQEKGMEAMDGPINFGNRDRWWGLLIEGYDREPNYQCNYHLPYYKKLFENWGFQVYFYQLTFGRPIKGPMTEAITRKAKLVEADENYSFSYLRKSEWNTLAEKMQYVYNKAWADRSEIPPLRLAQVNHMVSQIRPIMDEKLLWFGYYRDEPIAFFLSIPDLNQFFRYVDGKLDLIRKFIFLWHKWKNKNQRIVALLFGVTPEHQGKGVDGAIVDAFSKVAWSSDFSYSFIELNWIGDFNPRMIRVAEQIDTRVVKKHVTFRKYFDTLRPFKRRPIIG